MHAVNLLASRRLLLPLLAGAAEATAAFVEDTLCAGLRRARDAGKALPSSLARDLREIGAASTLLRAERGSQRARGRPEAEKDKV